MNTVNMQTYPCPKITLQGRKPKSKIDPSSYCAFMFSDRELGHQTCCWWRMLKTAAVWNPGAV